MSIFDIKINFTLFLNALSILVTVFIFRTSLKQPQFKARYETLLLPLFDSLEPHLYSDYKSAPISEAVTLIQSNKQCASVRLIELAYYLEHYPNQENYNHFCRRVIWEYNYLAFLLGFGIHGITYRLNRNQYQTKLMFILYIVFWCSMLIICLIVALVVFSFIAVFMEKLLYLTL